MGKHRRMNKQPSRAVSSMLPLLTVPPCLLEMLQICRSAFGAPGFATFVALVVGALGAVGPRTVTGMWAAAGLAGRVHWSRAHRFFSEMKWEPDTLGLILARLVVGLFVAAGAAVPGAGGGPRVHPCRRPFYRAGRPR